MSEILKREQEKIKTPIKNPALENLKEEINNNKTLAEKLDSRERYDKSLLRVQKILSDMREYINNIWNDNPGSAIKIGLSQSFYNDSRILWDLLNEMKQTKLNLTQNDIKKFINYENKYYEFNNLFEARYKKEF